MKRIILSSALLLLLASCLKNVDNSEPVIEIPHTYTQWQEVKGAAGWIDITNANILTITDDSTYHYNFKNFHFPDTRSIDSIGFLKSSNKILSFISRDKKDTILFYFSMQNDSLGLGFEGGPCIDGPAGMMYKKVH